MRLKPTPMNEASIIFSITWVLTFLAFALFSGDLNQALRASSISIVFLLLSYILWILTGYWWRKKGPQQRFFMNVTVSSAVAIGALLLMNQAVTASTLADDIKTNASGYFIAVAIIFFLTSVIAAALTQFLLVRPKKAKI
jgi:drug/metabolite transporter (DMT)-like permease